MDLLVLLSKTQGEAAVLSGSPVIFRIIGVAFGLFVVYWLLLHPKSKEMKRTETMLKEMKVGDVVITTSGFYGVVIDITEDDVIVEFGSNHNCRIPMRKSAIEQVEHADDAAKQE